MKSKTKKIAYLGLLTALAMVLSYVEVLLPPIIASLPGIKMGLANIAVVFALYVFSFREAFMISLVRVFAMSLLFGDVLTLAYSTAGAVLSLSVMFVLKRTDKFSTVGVSVAGGVSHNIGQILVAVFAFKTVEIGYYMIVLTVSGTVAGILVGSISAILTNKLKNKIL